MKKGLIYDYLVSLFWNVLIYFHLSDHFKYFKKMEVISSKKFVAPTSANFSYFA